MAEALYPYSREEAKREGELERWRESHRANISCARNLSGLIDTHARQGQLEPDTAQFALKQWGVLRVQFVLANTLTATGGLGFEPDSLRWARSVFVPPGKTNGEFRVQADRALLAQFVQQVHTEYQALGMFGPEHCGGADQDYTGKVLVLRPDRLRDECWSAQNQLWLGEMGFGCSPASSGRAVYATCLGDGEKTRWNRADFLGVLDEQHLPDWAAEKLAELRGTTQKQADHSQERTDSPAQDGMELR